MYTFKYLLEKILKFIDKLARLLSIIYIILFYFINNYNHKLKSNYIKQKIKIIFIVNVVYRNNNLLQ